MKTALKTIVGVLTGIFVILLVAKIAADKTYFNDYDPKLPFDARVSESTMVEDSGDFFGITRHRHFEKVVFSMQTRKDERMPVILTLPAKRTGKVPVIIFLHGIGQSKGFLEDICSPFNEGGFAMACFDQLRQPRPASTSRGFFSCLAQDTATTYTIPPISPDVVYVSS